MIKGVTNLQLRAILRDRLAKLAESEDAPDPGPGKPSERSSALYELAFRRGTVRQLVELIVLAESDWNKPTNRSSENDVEYYKTLCERVIETEKRKLDNEWVRGTRKHHSMKREGRKSK